MLIRLGTIPVLEGSSTVGQFKGVANWRKSTPEIQYQYPG